MRCTGSNSSRTRLSGVATAARQEPPRLGLRRAQDDEAALLVERVTGQRMHPFDRAVVGRLVLRRQDRDDAGPRRQRRVHALHEVTVGEVELLQHRAVPVPAQDGVDLGGHRHIDPILARPADEESRQTPALPRPRTPPRRYREFAGSLEEITVSRKAMSVKAVIGAIDPTMTTPGQDDPSQLRFACGRSQPVSCLPTQEKAANELRCSNSALLPTTAP